jgi:hypothetical protein
VSDSSRPSACSFGLSATSQQYFYLRTNQPPAISQQYFSLRTNQHQPLATSHTNRLHALKRRSIVEDKDSREERRRRINRTGCFFRQTAQVLSITTGLHKTMGLSITAAAGAFFFSIFKNILFKIVVLSFF